MARAPATNFQSQIKQTQYEDLTHGSVPASPHPMATGGIPSGSSAQAGQSQGSPPDKRVTVKMSKLSLLAISLSLMLLGAFTFLGGFLLGMWFEMPSRQQVAASQRSAHGYVPSEAMHGAGAGAYPAPAHHGSALSGFQQESQSIGFQNIAGRQANVAAMSAIGTAHIPGVPSFLTPLVASTQAAVGRQVGYKAQQRVSQSLSPQSSAPSSPQPRRESPRLLPPSHEAPSFRDQHSQMLRKQGAHSQVLQTAGSTPVSSAMKGPSSSSVHSEKGSPEVLTYGARSDGNSSSKGEKYTIQLGVYATEENAEAFVNQLQLLDYSAHVLEKKGADGGPLFYVYSGNYPTYELAVEAASQFASDRVPGAFVVQVSQESKGVS